MNILLISYDNYQYDGRLRELIRAAKELGEVTYITRASEKSPRKRRIYSIRIRGTALLSCLSADWPGGSAGRI